MYFFRKVKYIFVFFILVNLSFFASFDRNITILISFDGFRYDYMDLVETPNFDFIEKNGVKANSLKPIFPSFTFPNHYSIATGCYTDKHGILGNVFYDFNRNQTYSYKDASTVRDGSWYGCEPIWVTAEKNNIKSATYFWVGSEAKINNYRPSIYKYYKNGVDPIEKINEVISWIEYPKEEQPELITLYFNEPDHSGHVYGSEALNTLDEIVYADYLLGYLLSSLSSAGLENAVNLIIVSDHGMVDVSVDRTINIDNIIDHDYKVYGKGPFLELHDGSYFNVKNTYTNFTIYNKHTIPYEFHFKTDNTGDYLLLADLGYLLYSSKDIEEGLPVVGMHGYDPNYMNMHGIFYAYGPDFQTNMKISTFELIHIYPLMCEILHIRPYDNIDGSLNVLEHILK